MKHTYLHTTIMAISMLSLALISTTQCANNKLAARKKILAPAQQDMQDEIKPTVKHPQLKGDSLCSQCQDMGCALCTIALYKVLSRAHHVAKFTRLGEHCCDAACTYGIRAIDTCCWLNE